jgi:hypothetical protein
VNRPEGAEDYIIIPQHALKLLLLVIDHLISSQALTKATLPALAVVPTLALRCFANWIANMPRPPAPAGMNTFGPGFR